MDKIYTAIGLMSGTSLDGVDASIIRSDGEKLIEIKKNLYLAYDFDFKKKLNCDGSAAELVVLLMRKLTKIQTGKFYFSLFNLYTTWHYESYKTWF